jgi:hypothetical protein
MSKKQVDQLGRRGFTVRRSTENPRYLEVTCDQCCSVVVNGVAVHERGCPNERRKR